VGLIHAIVYGIVQGLTEFLPISSNAHIRIVSAILFKEDPGAAFTAVIQLGTVAAVLIYFARDLWAALTAWARSLGNRELRNTAEAKMGWAVFWGTIPVVVFGLALHEKVETTFRSLYYIAASLILMGIVMLLADMYGKHKRKVEDVEVNDGVVVGFWQVLSLIPGMSRSGSTISGALFAGFDRAAAARFSFLLSVPSVTAAGLYEAYKERHALISSGLMPTLVATVVSFIVGYASIAFLIRYLQKRGIGPFVLYRVVLGVILLIAISQGVNPDEGAKPITSKPPLRGVGG